MRHPVGGRGVPRLAHRALLVIAGLAALGLLALALGVVRLSAPGLAHPADAVSDSDIAAQRSDSAEPVVDDPVLTTLAETLREQGIAAAQRQLVALGAVDPGMRRREHHYFLAVGQLSYAQTRDVAESFRLCGAAPDTGCYHGVMDAFVASTPRLAREDIALLCDGAPITAETPAVRIQCVHGVGHGLAHAGDRVADALASCDGFGTVQDREACYIGVFGQVIEHTEERPDSDPFALDPTLQTPFATCIAVAERYRRACYTQQPTVILAANGEDVPAAFITCDQAPVAYIVTCYQGVGAWISIFTHWDPDQTSSLCQRAALPFRPWCLDGAVAGMASGHATADRPMALCRSTPPDLRTFCLEALGERIPLLYADRPAQERACAMAQDPAWIQVCRRSAGLPAPLSAAA
jgi:hypothetical protein